MTLDHTSLTSDTLSHAFRIPDENFSELVAKLEQLNKRARKISCPAITWEETQIERATEKEKTPLGDYKDVIRFYHHIIVTGQAPKIAGYTFIATIEHLVSNGQYENLVKSVPQYADDFSVAQYRAMSPYCEHCELVRRRNNTYIVRNDESGVMLQVGSNCLVDFFGHKNPLSVALSLEYLSDAIDMCRSSEESYGHSAASLDLESYLQYVSACMRLGGWVSRGKAKESVEPIAATCEIALSEMQYAQEHSGYRSYSSRDNHEVVIPTDADKKRAGDAIVWIRGYESHFFTEKEDYLYNLYVVCKRDILSFRHIGIAASCIAAWERATSQKIERESVQAISTWQGDVGKRLTVLNMLVTGCYESEGNYGVTFIYQMKDDSGNQYTWFSSNGVLEKGETYTLTGTVKKHDEYKGVQKTILTRCKVL